MIVGKTKEVYYDKWCNKCINKNVEEIKDPCNECLTQGWNEFSHKPINFEEA